MRKGSDGKRKKKKEKKRRKEKKINKETEKQADRQTHIFRFQTERHRHTDRLTDKHKNRITTLRSCRKKKKLQKRQKRFIAKNNRKRLAVTDIHSHASLSLLKTRFIAFESRLLQKVKALENADTVFRN